MAIKLICFKQYNIEAAISRQRIGPEGIKRKKVRGNMARGGKLV